MDELNNILARYFEGTATEAERAQAEAWKADNAGEFEALRAAWELSGSVEYRQYDSARAWGKMAAELEPEAETAAPGRNR